jgi:hypothetical protein
VSWCDRLASVPTVGFFLDWHFASSNSVLEAFAPILDRMVEKERAHFNIVSQEAFSVSFNTEDGFQYGIEPGKVSVGFTHSVKAKAVTGGPPIMEMLSHPLPYTQLLTEVSQKLTEAALLLSKARIRKISKVGIVSNTKIDIEEAPPGITRFVEYVGRPWKGLVDYFSHQIVAEIGESARWSDRCVHTLARPENADELLAIVFDWQRTFKSTQAINPDSLRAILTRAQADALAYFEDLAEGSRFDEDDISGPA